MKPSAYLVNVARGAIVDEPSLISALERGLLAGAALDVTAREPLPPESPLWKLDNVFITPHVSGLSDRTGDVRRNCCWRIWIAGFPAANY